MVKIVYFGTSDFSAQVLEALATTQGFTVVSVVTQPARPTGRKQEITASFVKVMASKLDIPVLEPESLKTFDAALLPPADIFVVYAYGLIIPQKILDLPAHGVLNIHPSLLPKYRGPTPVQSAIINGEKETGVSIMLLDAQMDHGPILNQVVIPIYPDDTTTSLTNKLVTVAIRLLFETLPAWIEKKITPTSQNHEAATYCKLLTRDDGRIDWDKTAYGVYNLYRGLTPWPGVWTTWEGKRLKLLKIKVIDTLSSLKEGAGKVAVNDEKLLITCGKDAIEVLELQLEGKKAVDAKTFLTGYRNFAESKLE